ncbi:glycosyl hydrolase [Pedobacter sp. Leaf41]|uniref:glycoside hydrolase family 127 protein n=1 Tax=Pedobacter sp. Leaf41 TaxID=1736218 RepID=UPI000703770D|nr:glycoside hydrolase family 127 protein [Pedobacter sp. Leaf41]KQN39132.1 glycosyl hydrolase [Pedobacter sp. Leaf41]
MKFILSLICFSTVTVCCLAQQKITAFQLRDVRLLEGPFVAAQQTDLNYMLSLNADKLLAPYLIEAGLTPKTTSYGNWENTGLDGHIGGHYVSALSLMYASTGDFKVKQRLDYMIDELEKCQIKNGNGYLSGVPDGKKIWEQIKAGNIISSSFSLNDRWVPLYNIHKIYAGLYDAYAIAGNVKAKGMLIKLTDWCIDLVSGLTDKQIQTLLKSEHGGLNEVFANVYSITKDKKYLKLARQFSDLSILNPLEDNKDSLNGLHANTQIPKVIGFEQIALVAADTTMANAADFFWKTVVNHRTTSIGGNSVREHFHPSNDFSSMLESREGPETCNSYNMLKLTKQLFLANPSNTYLDYYERTLYNHILSSQRSKGGFVYFTPMRPGHYRTYSNPQESFWCCVGSGLENHGKYGELIYAHDEKNLFVNLFIPSQVDWKERGLKAVQRTSFPNTDFTTLEISLTKKQQFAVNFRYPSWVEKNKMQVFVNGKSVEVKDLKNGYVSVNRLWSTGDRIKVVLPMHTSTEFMPDGSDWVSFVHGPVVLAAALDTLDQPNITADGSRMGHIASGKLLPINEAPLVTGTKSTLANQVKPLPNDALEFSAATLIYQPKYKDLKLVPFYNLEEKRYVIYFPYATIEGLPERAKAIALAEKEKQALELATIDLVNTGEQQPESDHDFKGEKTENGTFNDQHFRNGSGWFSYVLQNKDLQARKVRLLLYGAEKNRTFDVIINSKLVTQISMDGGNGNTFFSKDILIPESLMNKEITLRFEASKGARIANIYEVRLMR